MIPKFRAWYDNKMWCLAKLDLWGDPDQAICDLAPYLPEYEELYDIYLSDVIIMQSTGLKDKNRETYFQDCPCDFFFRRSVLTSRNRRKYLGKSRITGRGMRMMENREVKEQLGELFIALSKMIGSFGVLALSVAFSGYVTMYL